MHMAPVSKVISLRKHDRRALAAPLRMRFYLRVNATKMYDNKVANETNCFTANIKYCIKSLQRNKKWRMQHQNGFFPRGGQLS